MDPEIAFGEDLFAFGQPWDVVFDALWVSHSEFWLVAGSGPGADIVTAIPDGDTIKGNGGAIGIPTHESTGRIKVALSVWEGPAPDGIGALLDTSRIEAPGREVTLVNVEGREPGPVLVLPDAGVYQVRVWRCSAVTAGEAEESEWYDIRLWPCPTPA